jgi:hypothetical protein
MACAYLDARVFRNAIGKLMEQTAAQRAEFGKAELDHQAQSDGPRYMRHRQTLDIDA